jgi:CHASE3 domain sensor protein
MSDPNAPAPIAGVPARANSRKVELLPLIAAILSLLGIVCLVVLIVVFIQYQKSTNSQISNLQTDSAMATIRMSLLEQK